MINDNSPFSKEERAALIGLGVALLVPFHFNAVFVLPELVVALYLLLHRNVSAVIATNIKYFAALAFSVLLGHFTGTSGAAEKTATLAFLKILMYMTFIAAVTARCKLEQNVVFLSRIVLGAAAVVMFSVWVDLFTDSLAFAWWHSKVTSVRLSIELQSDQMRSEGAATDLLSFVDYVQRGAGLALRPWQVLPWAICGLLSTMALRRCTRIRGAGFVLMIALFFGTPMLLPHRNALVGLFTFFLIYVLTAADRVEFGSRKVMMVCGISIFAALSIVGVGISTFMQSQQIVSSEILETAVSKWSRVPVWGAVRFDPRVQMFIEDAAWLASHPTYFLFGTGWNIILAPSIKPHNLYIAIVVASGVFGLAVLMRFLQSTVRRHLETKYVWRSSGAAAKAGIGALMMVGMSDNYLTFRLGVPATLLALWLTLCIVSAPRCYYPHPRLARHETPNQRISRLRRETINSRLAQREPTL